MTDDLASAYSSIYDKKEEGKEQIDEALPIVPIIKGAMMAKNVVDGVKNIMPKKKQERGGTANNLEHVEIEHLDGGTTEIVDVVKPEPLGNSDENLADRLWDQVAANLTTLGEMAGVRYQVSPVEELEEKKKSKMADKDYDGDGKVESGTDEYMGSRDKAIKKAMAMKKESFNVKSPVIFSKPEEKVEESISEEAIEKYASSISKAHKAIKK